MNQNGRSMVEMLGVLAIIGVLSVGGIAGYSKAMHKYKVNKFSDQMTHIIANIQASFGVQGTTDGLNNENIKKMGLVPSEMYKTKDSDYPEHFWGGQIYFGSPSFYAPGSGGKPTTSDNIFRISMNKIPKDVCITMLTADWGTDLYGMGGNFLGGAPNPSSMDWRVATENYAITGDKNYPAPFSVARATKVCTIADKQGATDQMALFWYFKL